MVIAVLGFMFAQFTMVANLHSERSISSLANNVQPFALIFTSSYVPRAQAASRLLFYVVTICPSAVHPVGCYYFTNSNNYQSSIPSEWNVDAECPRRYSKVFVYYNCVFTSTKKSNFVAVWNLVGGGTCITGKTVTILQKKTAIIKKHKSM